MATVYRSAPAAAAYVARHRNYRCPDCAGVFRVRLMHPDEPAPDRCALCGSWMNIDAPPQPVFVAEAPAIKENAYVKSVDQTYRAIEQASIDRALEAADILEVPVSEVSHMKITNMREPNEMREGDTAAITQTPPSLRSAGSQAGFQALGGGVPNYMPGVGPAMAGEATRQTITGSHSSRAAAMTRAGNMGSWRES